MQGVLFGGGDAPTKRVKYFAGYSWGMPLGDQADWCQGVVVTPRWVPDLIREECELPVVLDNGAFGAWCGGVAISFYDQVNGLTDSIRRLGSGRVKHIITPDVVGDARMSWHRTIMSLPYLSKWHGRLLFPLQDASDCRRYIKLARKTGNGLFVGGSTKRFKREMVEAIRYFDPMIRVHVGRISKEHELAHAAAWDVDSFDTTTFMRKQDRNKAIDWRPRFEKYVARRERVIKRDVVLLCSGGVDSAALLVRERERVGACLFVDYGQPAAAQEWAAMQALSAHHGVPAVRREMRLELGQMGEGEGAQVVPVRNAALAMLAANYAAANGYAVVMLGAQSNDRREYADCTERYVRAMRAVTRPFGVKVHAPWLSDRVGREELVRIVREEGLLGLTWSCYGGGPEPCGECASCLQ